MLLATLVAFQLLLLGSLAGMAQTSTAQTPNGAVTPGVPISWQSSVPAVTAVVSGPYSCLHATPDIDKGSLILANRCGGDVTAMVVRDFYPSTAPFVPTAQAGERIRNREDTAV